MHSAAQCLVGRHDFGSFVPANFDGSRERTVFSAECRREGDTVTIEIDAEGFMRQMVRSIAGTLIDVGRGAISHPQFRTIMLACDRATAGRTAPADGLYLVSVHYADGTSLPMQTHSQPHHVTGLTAVATQEKR
jgi:tRNA pseudouridine38-40 synthase